MNSDQIYFWAVVVIGFGVIGYLIALNKKQKLEKKKDLIRKYGTSGINYYAHKRCSKTLLALIEQEGDVIDQSRTTNWESKELVGKYGDITHCDVCKKEFKADDSDGFISYWATSRDELDLWQEIRKE